jgi:hypothetical protein
MTRPMIARGCGLLLLILCLVAVGARVPGAEAAGPWRGQVVDLETGQPLEGVVVVAVWEKVSPGVMHPRRDFEDVDEVVTDSDGRFVIPARRVTTLNPFVNIEGPTLVMFKPGYGRWGFRGEYEWLKRYSMEEQDARIAKAREEFESTGAQFELPRLKTPEERRNFLSHVASPFSVPPARIPRLSVAIDEEELFLGIKPPSR